MTELSYFLAVDVGTSRIAAATARVAADGSIVTAPFALGRKSDTVATVVFVADDGELSFGDVAERRGVTQPERLIREFKRSIGDEVPLMVGGRSLAPEQLYAQTVAAIVELVEEREGRRPRSGFPHAPHRVGRSSDRADPLRSGPGRHRRRGAHHRARSRRPPLRGIAFARDRADARGVRPRRRHIRLRHPPQGGGRHVRAHRRAGGHRRSRRRGLRRRRAAARDRSIRPGRGGARGRRPRHPLGALPAPARVRRREGGALVRQRGDDPRPRAAGPVQRAPDALRVRGDDHRIARPDHGRAGRRTRFGGSRAG